MTSFIKKLVPITHLPIMIDSTNPVAIESALKLIGGKAIVNSVNLEDGGVKLRKVLSSVKEYGAAVVALTIDEKGMADTAKRKLDIAKKIFEIAADEFKIHPSNILFDVLTFSIASGDKSLENSAKETIEGIKLIKKHFKESFTSLGVSNVSFGFSPPARRVLNSVFLNETIKAGLDAAIINAERLTPLHMLSKTEIKLAHDLIYNNTESGNPLINFLNYFKGLEQKVPARLVRLRRTRVAGGPGPLIEDELRARIVNGSKEDLAELIQTALLKYKPIEIINNILLDGMKEVGELFGAGKTQLPFVLQSAEVMKAFVELLKPYMKQSDKTHKGSIVLATVREDVHDIGKNLVDIILSNNGYKVYNLGVKQPVEEIIKAIDEHKPNAVGLSGLLIKSTEIMKEDLEELKTRGYALPVICGGAALNEKFVKNDLCKAYGSRVYYGKDAFSALKLMEKLCDL